MRTGQFQCLQKESRCFMIAIIAANLLLMLSLPIVLIHIPHPGYVADLCFFTRLSSGTTILALGLLVSSSHLDLLSFIPYLNPSSSMVFITSFVVVMPLGMQWCRLHV